MDSKNFFDFDVSLPTHDDNYYDEGGDEYDILNDETFGAAAVDGDWEQDHEKLSSITKEEKLFKKPTKSFPQEVPKFPNQLDDFAKFDALSINRQIREGTPDMGAAAIYGEHFSPLRDSIWSSPPNMFPSKRVQDEPPKTESGLSKNMPVGFEHNQRRNFKCMADIENELRKFQMPSSQLNNILPDNTHNPSRTQPIPIGNLPGAFPMRHPSQRRNVVFPNQMHKPPPGLGHHPMGAPMNQGYPHHGNFSRHSNPNPSVPWNNHQFPLRPFPPRMVDPNFMGLDRPMNFRHDRHPFEHNQHFNRHSMDNGGFDRNHMIDPVTAEKNRRIDADWNEWHRKKLLDPYTGLMTPKEKEWLRNIQTMTLQTNNPFKDDFYCTMLQLKKEKKMDEGVIKLDGLQLVNKSAKDEREYAPPPMEDSLGKLQVLSVHAPRKIVDLQVVHLDPSCPTTPLQKEMRRNRQALLYLEKLCNTFLSFEDLQRKIRGLPDCPTRDSYRTQSGQLLESLWQGFSCSNPSFFVQLLSIRKGKSLLAKVIPWLKHENMSELFVVIVSQLPNLQKKDSPERSLSLLWPGVDSFLATTIYEDYLILGAKVTPHLQTIPSSVLDCPLAWSAILRILLGAEQFEKELIVQDSWQEFLVAILNVVSTTTPEALASITLPSSALKNSAEQIKSHLQRCCHPDPQLKQQTLTIVERLISLIQERPATT